MVLTDLTDAQLPQTDGCTVATNLQFIKKNIICKAQ